MARALRQQVNTTSIVKIKSETGDMKYEPKEILKAFHNFYSQLYNKPNQLAEKDPVKFQQNIRQYINETAIPTLTSVEIEQLEEDFSEIEIQMVIDALVPGKFIFSSIFISISIIFIIFIFILLLFLFIFIYLFLFSFSSLFYFSFFFSLFFLFFFLFFLFCLFVFISSHFIISISYIIFLHLFFHLLFIAMFI